VKVVEIQDAERKADEIVSRAGKQSVEILDRTAAEAKKAQELASKKLHDKVKELDTVRKELGEIKHEIERAKSDLVQGKKRLGDLRQAAQEFGKGL
jgi:cell division septum initiation protein DivIVA